MHYTEFIFLFLLFTFSYDFLIIIRRSIKSSHTEERIENILKYLTYEVWRFTQRSLYEKHKLLFTLMLAMKIDCHKGKITHEEFMTFIKGKVHFG